MKEEWKEALDTLRNEGKWCIAGLPNKQIDPYGSTSIHGAVAKVIVGSHYDLSKKVDFTLEQVFFFPYLLELAMEDKNLSHVDG
jgi:D-arabinose 1-dehydrogenase-like Zn-dependent alcohol dehydrogenase